ncbi:MAG: oligosaccharide flippase family protein [Ignavibacteriaceae bacterium]|nr:oligosaccharide flippase family protein [Ignavibacteriaceae bacterium]
MSQKSSLGFSTFLYTLTGFTVKGISFLLLPFYSYFFSAEEFGIASLMMGVSVIAAVFFQLGMQTIFPKFYLEYKDIHGSGKVLSLFFFRYIIWAGILFFLLFTFSESIARLVHGNGNYTVYYQMLFLAAAVETVSMTIIQYFRTEQQAGTVALLQFASTLVHVAVLVTMLLTGFNNIFSFASAHLVSPLIILPMGIFLIRGQLTMNSGHIPLKPVLVFGIPVVAGALFSTLLDVSDRFILLYYLSEEEVGIYSFMYRIALGLNVFVIAFRTAWTPAGIELMRKGEYSEKSPRVFRNLINILVLLSLAFLLLSKAGFTHIPGLGQFFAGNYGSGIGLIPILLTAYIFSGLVSYFSIYPYTLAKGNYFLKMDLTGIVINAGLNFLLIPLIGIYGAAVATLMAFMSVFLYISRVSLRSVSESIRLSDVTVPLLILLVGYSSFYLIENIFVLSGVLISGIGLLIYYGGIRLQLLWPQGLLNEFLNKSDKLS